MTKATNQKTKSAPRELPPGWEFDKQARDFGGYRAIKPGANLHTMTFTTKQEAILAAHGVEAAGELELLGLAGKGLISQNSAVEEGGTCFHPGFPPNFDPERTERGLAQENSNGIMAPLEQILRTPLDNWNEEADGAFDALRKLGATDKVLLSLIAKAFNSCTSLDKHISWKGGKNPKFQMETGPCEVTALTGKRLLAKAREVLRISSPGAMQVVEEEDEQFVRPRAEVCILCGEPVGKGHLCQPGKEPKPLVEPSLVCVCGHRADAHAPFNHPEEPPQECVECKCDLFVDATTAPPAIAMLRAIPTPAPGVKSAQKRATVETAIAPDPAAERLHEEAVARWRRERPASADAGESNGYHPQMLRMIPLDDISPSLTNPRKHFDPVKLRELADSIIEHGLIEPILVRPIHDPLMVGSQTYELVAGERRWRATILAKLERIEAKVRDLDDKAVLEIQFIENLQRADLSAIEEAEGYKRLLDEHGYTADSLAGKLAKSKSYVYGRLKLCNLPPAAMEAMAKGDLPATVGELIGRLPSMEMREDFWEDNFYGIGNDYFEMPSFRDVKLEIEGHYMRELKSSSFSQADKKLLPEAGSCKDCPKRTGNNRVDYPDGRADICTDVPCYERKVEAHFTREAEKAKESGMKVLSQSEARKIFHGVGDTCWLTSEGRQKYVQLEDSPRYDTEKRSYKELLDGHLKPVIVIDPKGKSHLLAPRTEAERIVKEQHGIKPDSPSSNHDSYKASQKKREEEKKLRQATAEEISRRAVSDLEYNLFGDLDFLRVIAKLLIRYLDVDIRDIAKRRGIEYDAKVMSDDIIDRIEDADLPMFIVEWLLLDDLDSWVHYGAEQNRPSLCDYFKLKPRAVMKEVSAKLKAGAKEAAKAKPKPKAKAAAKA